MLHVKVVSTLQRWPRLQTDGRITMKFSPLAVDYDGTIATNGQLDPEVRCAIGELRQRGITVILVTGRRLSDLRRAAGDLVCFDVVVCENGAVLEFPASGRHVALAHAPHPVFLAELARRGITFTAGGAVVEAEASAAPAILDVVRSLEQPLILAFNRNRLMVLPPGVAKSTGLRLALSTLRLSIHNTIGIGDAENDHGRYRTHAPSCSRTARPGRQPRSRSSSRLSGWSRTRALPSMCDVMIFRAGCTMSSAITRSRPT